MTSQDHTQTVGGVRDLADLLARVEAATRSERELDGAIYRMLFSTSRALIDPGDMRTKRPGEYGTVADLAYLSDADLGEYMAAPKFTASIDAALALAERCLPGHQWELCWGSMRPRPAAKHAEYSEKYGKFWRVHEGATPALALIAALLKALIAQAARPTGGQLGPGLPPENVPLKESQ